MDVETADDLYGLPLDRFIPERGALARAQRDKGDSEVAARVAKLRKPSVAAWAVNQLVRTQTGEIAELFAAGDAARRAQAELLAGRGDGDTLRDAGRSERDAVASLVEAARGLLSSSGHELSPAILERVADTLHAAALDQDARALVADGRLERELRHIGMSSAPAPAGPPPPKRAESERAARSAEAAARRAEQRALRALEVAEERRDRAAQALAEAESALAEARATAEAAADEHRQASKTK